MGKNIIRMKEEDLAEASQKLKKSYVEADELVLKAPQKFSQIKNTGLFSDGFSIINGQINSVATSINNLGELLRKNTDSFFDLERNYAAKAEEIEIPIDFIKYDSREINSISDITLNKKDGKSIKTYKPGEIEDQVDYSGENEELEKLKTNNEYGVSTYDSNSSISKNKLGNILFEDETKEQSYEDNYDIEGENLRNIVGEDALQSELDDSTVIGKSLLKSINKGDKTSQKDVDTLLKENKGLKKELKSIKNDNVLQSTNNKEDESDFSSLQSQLNKLQSIMSNKVDGFGTIDINNTNTAEKKRKDKSSTTTTLDYFNDNSKRNKAKEKNKRNDLSLDDLDEALLGEIK